MIGRGLPSLLVVLLLFVFVPLLGLRGGGMAVGGGEGVHPQTLPRGGGG